MLYVHLKTLTNKEKTMRNMTIERHIYAPELTKVFIRGHRLDIKQPFSGWDYDALRNNPKRLIREKHLSPLKRAGHFFTVEKVYKDENNSWLDRTLAGFGTYKDCLKIVKQLKEGLVGPADIKVKIELIG